MMQPPPPEGTAGPGHSAVPGQLSFSDADDSSSWTLIDHDGRLALIEDIINDPALGAD